MASKLLKQLAQFARAELGFLPTPVTHLSRLSDVLSGPEIHIKRDDLTGLALGGNKTRKLEYIMGDALNRGADCVITSGAIQSNHCRQTAAAAAQLGLDCHLLLGGQKTKHINGNLLLDQLLNASIHWSGDNRKGEGTRQLVEVLERQGRRPYVIPYGGSNTLGALGFVNAFAELAQQGNAEPFTHIIFASSSGGTHAGLMVGKQLLESQCQIVGVNIDKVEDQSVSFGDNILKLPKNQAVYFVFFIEKLYLRTRYSLTKKFNCSF